MTQLRNDAITHLRNDVKGVVATFARLVRQVNRDNSGLGAS